MLRYNLYRLLSLLFIVGILLTSSVSVASYTFNGEGLYQYQSFEELKTWAAAFEAANPDLVRVVEFGSSHQSVLDIDGNQTRPLLAIQLTVQDPAATVHNDPAKPEFLFTGGVHAREVIGSEAAYRLAKELVSAYNNPSHDNYSAAIDILSEREVWIVPNLNPDGRILVENGYSKQRKNMEVYDRYSSDYNGRQNSGLQANGQLLPPNIYPYQAGVDLNRNFPHRWSDAVVENWYAVKETFHGPAPLSAPEASSLWSLLHDQTYFSNMFGAIDFHSGAATILAPWVSPGDNSQNPLLPDERAKLDLITLKLSEHTKLPSQRLNYESYGTLTDSLYEEFGAYSFCIELHNGGAGDIFRQFNPLYQTGVDTAVQNAIKASMFLLSDEAFALVPEPAAWLLALLASTWLMTLRRRT